MTGPFEGDLSFQLIIHGHQLGRYATLANVGRAATYLKAMSDGLDRITIVDLRTEHRTIWWPSIDDHRDGSSVG
jgi:hypothetical protein